MKNKVATFLLVLGFALAMIGVAQQNEDNKLFQVGNIRIERQDNNFNWMMVAGGFFAIASMVIFVVPGRK